MKKLIVFFLACLMLLFSAYWRLPDTSEIKLSLPKPEEKSILIPLDSRPVCTTLPQDIAYLAGVQLILPPNELLDKYTKPANKDFLHIWLKNEAINVKSSIISTDLLLHGGLLHGRTHIANEKEQNELVSLLNDVAEKQSDTKAFSVIPRLLVTDEVLPDAWYWYHLMKYSETLDTSLIFGDFKSAEIFSKYDAEIPNDIKTKYREIFKASKNFNTKLLTLADRTEILIGQDDANAFGLPRMTREIISLDTNAKRAKLTNGADELATLLVARSYIAKQSQKPKVYVHYADPKSKFMHAPYMSITNTQAAREALEIIGLTEAENAAAADIILFISYGNDKFIPNKTTVDTIKNYLKDKKVLAIVDNSQNFETEELLLPKLLSENVELNKITAYAGWNTLGNSLGTAISQAAVFVARKNEIGKDKYPALHAENLRLNINRFLDDYYYQKLKHASLAHDLYVNYIDSRNLDQEEKSMVEHHLMAYTSLRSHQMLHSNLGRTSFYEQDGTSYYLTDIVTSTELPWNRIFEVSIQAYPKFGIKK